MLSSMRDWSQSWPAKVLLTLLLISLGAFLGFRNLFMGGDSEGVLIEVGSEKVLVNKLMQPLSYHAEVLAKHLGRRPSTEEQKQFGLIQRALNDLVVEASTDDEVNKLGLRVADSQVRSALEKEQVLQDEKGHFSVAAFKEFLRRNGMQERTFIQMQKKHLARQQLMRLVRLMVPFPAPLPRLLEEAIVQKRTVDLLLLKQGDLYITRPSENALRIFFRKDEKRFQRPERRDFSFCVLHASDLASTAGKQKIDQQRAAHKIMQNIQETIDDGQSLEDIATQYKLLIEKEQKIALSDDSKSTATKKLQPLHRNKLLARVFQQQKVASSVRGEIVMLRLNNDTHVLVRLDDIHEPFVPAFSDVLSEVEKAFMQDAQRKALEKKAKTIKSHLAKGVLPKGFERSEELSLETTAQNSVLPVPVRDMIFSMGIGDIKTVDLGDRIYILTGLRMKKGQLSYKEQSKLSASARRQLEESFLNSYVQALKAMRHITYNQKAIKSLSR